MGEVDSLVCGAEPAATAAFGDEVDGVLCGGVARGASGAVTGALVWGKELLGSGVVEAAPIGPVSDFGRETSICPA
ncbi:hypothetical protein [Nocardia abscessus]|uniref:hypothetical protein n=1 Tax=Nocardia abscessus TaxID=120957 RepID=UPI002458038A|nr:hypothetical protein [Nocardia abscessus]